ncbi:UbiA prenyltransferase family-domain-containing protein [Russula vinacea]|nr:UbiA prenyltransferase family-domain-containing protein [Russula vinacea]
MPPTRHYSSLLFHLYTLFLFTKSDMKTLIPPVTLFAAATVPAHTISGLLHTVLWLWVHTLQLGLANQTLPYALSEDLVNHPDRPLPTGRITIRQARTLRWMMIPLCFLLSATYGPRTLLTSFGVSLFVLAYNECGGARSHWLVRNVLNAIGYALAEAGATLVACQSESDTDSTVWIAVVLSAGIILTTIHTQDYKDVLGDAISGRVTLPIAYPAMSRAATAFFWTWHLDDVAAAVLGVLALVVGISFVARTDSRSDKVSFYWYNVWLSAVYVLPGYYRLRLLS